MKIIHIAPNSYPFLGGIEVLLKNYTKYEFESKLNEHVITFPDRAHKFEGEFKVEGTRVIPMPVLKQKPQLPYFPKQSYRPNEIAEIFSKYKELLIREKPDIIHFHDYSEASLPMLSISRSLNIKRLHHIHIMIDASFPADLIANLKYERNFVAVSQAVAGSIIDEIQDDLLPIIVPNGIIQEQFTRELKQMESNPTILMAGRCVPSKGFDIGLRIFNLLLETIPNAQLIIAGYGKQFNVLKATAEEIGISEKVRFIKGPHPSDVQKLMLKSWVTLVPSQFQEGFSLVAAEAALNGVPVLTTRVGGLPETVINGLTGLVVDPNDESAILNSLVKLLNDAKLREFLGKNAKERAQMAFSMERFARDINNVYQNLQNR